MSLDDVIARRAGVQSRVASWLHSQGHQPIDDSANVQRPTRVIMSRAGLGAKVVSKAERELQERVDKKLAKVLKPSAPEPELPKHPEIESLEPSRTDHNSKGTSYAHMLSSIRAGCPTKTKKRKKPSAQPPSGSSSVQLPISPQVAHPSIQQSPQSTPQLQSAIPPIASAGLSKSQLKKQRRKQKLSLLQRPVL